MKLIDTVDMMNSDNYQDRFKAEYHQLRIRIEKLSLFLDKYFNNELDFKPDVDYDLLHEQLVHMVSYKTVLKERARIEKIDLT